MKPKPYNGHHCWNCWNVALWLGNDEPLYRAAMSYVYQIRDKQINATVAARRFIKSHALETTPDGARYTVRAVRSALIGFLE